MGDLRPPSAPFIDAFGLPVTLTRPAPDDVPIVTTGLWVPQAPVALVHGASEPQLFGTDFKRREPRRLMGFTRAAVPALPRGTVVIAAEEDGQATKTWMVDGIERLDVDWWVAILVRTSPFS